MVPVEVVEGRLRADADVEVGVAGAAGMDLKETERLIDVPTEGEAIEWTVAFVQLYRENAKYLDRPYKWVAKVGLDWVKEVLGDDEARSTQRGGGASPARP